MTLLLGSGLSGLLLQHFAGVSNALLLVRVWLPEPGDVRRDLTDQLSVHAGDGDVRLLVDGEIDPLRDVEHDRMRVAEREYHLLAFDLCPVSDADDVQFLLETFGHARDGIRDQTLREPVEFPKLRVVGRTFGHQMAVGDLEVDARRMRLAQLSLGSLDFDGAVDHFDGHALGNRDWFLSDSGHVHSGLRHCSVRPEQPSSGGGPAPGLSLTKRYKEPLRPRLPWRLRGRSSRRATW